MNQPDEKILSKIQKCLALSQSSEPHEAAAAMRQAQKLMEIHNISMAAVKQSDIGTTTVKSKVSVSKVSPWELKLINTVAKAFGCRLMWTQSRSWATDVYGSFTLVGLKTQTELAQYTCEVMQRKLIKARGEFVTAMGPSVNRAYKTAQANGFCMGWIESVSKTVHDFALNTEVVLMIKTYISEHSGGKKSAAKNVQIGSSGFAAGREAGAGESIHRPMGKNNDQLMIGR